jgi:hypothetical protein
MPGEQRRDAGNESGVLRGRIPVDSGPIEAERIDSADGGEIEVRSFTPDGKK